MQNSEMLLGLLIMRNVDKFPSSLYRIKKSDQEEGEKEEGEEKDRNKIKNTIKKDIIQDDGNNKDFFEIEGPEEGNLISTKASTTNNNNNNNNNNNKNNNNKYYINFINVIPYNE